VRETIAARIIDTSIPGHVTFFYCGADLDLVGCPHCRKDIGGPLWKDLMDQSSEQGAGFTLTERMLPCCGKPVRPDQLVFDPPCAFGSFAIEVTDPLRTLSDGEWNSRMRELEARLQCLLQRVDAHY
jgi:hypothetical protein